MYIEIGKEEGGGTRRGNPRQAGGEGVICRAAYSRGLRDHRLAQEEIFGPVLAVIKVKTLEEAFDVANSTRYALTGGLYSRSPVHRMQGDGVHGEFVSQSRDHEVLVGTVLWRFRMSGIGSKAGGPDYLQQFLIPINITENTLRRGFAPEVVVEEVGE
ncbi:MAG: aldehyde dehydrogenase family protein [Planctomycetales bacterium]